MDETSDDVLVRAEFRGLGAQDFTAEATSEHLSIRGEKGEEREAHRRRFYRLERRAGAFMRRVGLPCEVDPARASADHRHSVFRVRLPNTEAGKARKVHFLNQPLGCLAECISDGEREDREHEPTPKSYGNTKISTLCQFGWNAGCS